MVKRTGVWHEDDRFWESCECVLFSERRLAQASEEVDKILSLLVLQPGSRILDLCCGVGRHSLELACRGFHVVGVDRTEAYLNRASREARKRGVDIEFVREDMRHFVRPDTFDAVLSLFTSFGYFAEEHEDFEVVQNVHHSLKPGGLFLIDLVGKEVLAKVFRERDWREENGIMMLEERKLSQNWGWIENRWTVLSDVRPQEWTVSLRLYSAVGLRSLLLQCGFESVSVYGDLAGAPYDQNARRLVVLARKRKERTE